jgi:hypothetical protein
MRRSYVVPMRWMVIYEYEVTGGALNLSSTKLPRPWSPWGTSSSRKNPHERTGNRTRDLIISIQKLWPLDHEAGRLLRVQEQDLFVTDIRDNFRRYGESGTARTVQTIWLDFRQAQGSFRNFMEPEVSLSHSQYLVISLNSEPYNRVYSLPNDFLYIHSNIIPPPRLVLPNCILPSDFTNETTYAPLISLIRTTRPANHNSLDFITLIIFGEEYR